MVYAHYTSYVRSLKMNLLNILQPSFEVIAFRFFAEAEGIQSLKFSGHKNKYCLHCKNVSCVENQISMKEFYGKRQQQFFMRSINK